MGLQICKEDGPCCSQGTDADTEAKIHHVPPSLAFQEDNGSFYGDLDSDRSPANLDEATLSKQLENSARLARLPTESLAVHREPRGRISRLEQGGQLVVDSAVLRSVSLSSTLRRFGWLWRLRPNKMNEQQLLNLFGKSKKSEELDIFFSHTWWTPGYRKYLSVLLSTFWHVALPAWLLSVVVLSLLYQVDVLPMPFVFWLSWADYQGQTAVAPWTLLVSSVVLHCSLHSAPLWASLLANSSCFYDAACIQQVDPAQRERGIYGIGGFLAVTKEMRILWSPPYLSRLWCIFEIAAFRRANPIGRLTFQPLFLERDFLLIWPLTFAFMCAYFTFIVSANWAWLTIIPMAVCFITFGPGIHGIRRSYLEQEQMLKDLAKFDVSTVSCANDFDKQFILEAISKWYGSVDAFNEYVRGPLKAELEQTVMNNRVPLSYVAYSVTPVFALTLDISISLWKGSVPKEIFWRHFFFFFFSAFMWSMFFIKVLHVLCRRGAAPRFKSRCMDYAQTTGLAIFWVVLNLIVNGAKVYFYRSSLVGAMLGFGVAAIVFIAMVYLSLR